MEFTLSTLDLAESEFFTDPWAFGNAADHGDPCGGRAACHGDPCGGRAACHGDVGVFGIEGFQEDAKFFTDRLGSLPPSNSSCDLLVRARLDVLSK